MTKEVLERMANKHMRKFTKIHLLTEKGRSMSPSMAFDTVVKDGTRTILLVPEGEEVKIDGKLIQWSKSEESRKVDVKPWEIRSVTKPLGSAEERPHPFAGLGTTTERSNQTIFNRLEEPEPEEPSTKRRKN
jgi:hypothetical protein